MAVVSMKQLLEAGVHFGHRTRRWNPKMKPYIFTERNGIHIIDLQQTLQRLQEAYDRVRDTVAEGGTVLLVGTKKQAQETIRTEAGRANVPYVNNRWLGGTLTNWRTIRQRIDYLLSLERRREHGEFENLPKKEALLLEREMDKLERRIGGLRDMRRLPQLLFIVDTRREELAVKEANILDIPIIAMVDTNCDPDPIDHVIPSNDDAIRAIKLMVGLMADAVLEGQHMRAVEEEVEEDEEGRTMEDYLGPSVLAKLRSGDYGAFDEDQEYEDEDEDEEVGEDYEEYVVSADAVDEDEPTEAEDGVEKTREEQAAVEAAERLHVAREEAEAEPVAEAESAAGEETSGEEQKREKVEE